MNPALLPTPTHTHTHTHTNTHVYVFVYTWTEILSQESKVEKDRNPAHLPLNESFEFRLNNLHPAVKPKPCSPHLKYGCKH